MTMQIEIGYEELKQAVTDYVKSKGMQVPPGARAVFQCHGQNLPAFGAIEQITAKLIIAEQQTAPPSQAST